MKISVVVTFLNEAEFILALLFGLATQTHLPDEVILVDAGSTDGTLELIERFIQYQQNFPIKLFSKKGNRSLGRNFGISQAKNDWIAITDAGCVPDQDWLAELKLAAQGNKADVVAGYYQGVGETSFQQAVTPYMLVMPDRVNPSHFLPATRSMLMHKKVWEKLGGFDESLQLSEDYDFAHKIDKSDFKLVFTDQAVVGWWPLETLGQFFQTVKGMAASDARAKLTRPKSWLVFWRYFLGILLFFCFSKAGLFFGFSYAVISLGAYSLWAVWKNAKYLDRGYCWLPVLQITADLGVMWGTLIKK